MRTPNEVLTRTRWAARAIRMMRATSVVILVVAALLFGAALGYAFVGAGFVQSGSRAPTNSAASPS